MKGPGGVPTIPATFDYLLEEVLELTNLDWNHFQHIWAT